MSHLVKQSYISIPGFRFKLGVHLVELTSSSAEDTTVCNLASSGAGESAAQLFRSGDSAATVTTSGNNTLRITGSTGQKVLAVTLHPEGNAVAEA